MKALAPSYEHSQPYRLRSYRYWHPRAPRRRHDSGNRPAGGLSDQGSVCPMDLERIEGWRSAVLSFALRRMCAPPIAGPAPLSELPRSAGCSAGLCLAMACLASYSVHHPCPLLTAQSCAGISISKAQITPQGAHARGSSTAPHPNRRSTERCSNGTQPQGVCACCGGVVSVAQQVAMGRCDPHRSSL